MMPIQRKKSRRSETTQSSPQYVLISTHLADNLKEIKKRLGNSPDLTIRKFELIRAEVQVAAVYIAGINDNAKVDEFVTHAMSFEPISKGNIDITSEQDIFVFIKEKALSIGEEKIIKDWDGLFEALLSGSTIILIDGLGEGVSGNTSGGEVRAVTEATTQVAIRGSKESFTESIGTNISLVRRKIKSTNLWTEMMKLGTVTQTDVSIMYIHGIASDKSIQKLKEKLMSIQIDSILESGYIEQLIEENKYSPFPTMYNTERPDSVAGNLLEGRIAIFVDGTPLVLIVPTTFFMFFHAVEDYYQRFEISTVIRLLRFMCLAISLLGPAITVAALSFHQEMVPTALLISLASQREGVPFPVFVEVILMEVTFEIIREAGIRMPSAIGQTVSIIGGLVLGQAATQAGIVSPGMVIVVSLTGIASFTTPAFNMALSIRLLRFVLTIVAAFIGLYGISIICFILVAHLCSLRSLGLPFMSPMAPLIPEDQKDTFIRSPLQYMRTRPRLVSPKSNVGKEIDKDNRGEMNEN
jgi:spore germination protein KA